MCYLNMLYQFGGEWVLSTAFKQRADIKYKEYKVQAGFKRGVEGKAWEGEVCIMRCKNRMQFYYDEKLD